MSQSKFAVGQRVSIMRSGAMQALAGPYRVVGMMPAGRSGRQYRVRHDGEAFDRIVDETRLEAVQIG